MKSKEEMYYGGNMREELEIINQLQQESIQQEVLTNSITLGCTHILTIVCC